MSIEDREYAFGVNRYKRPITIEDKEAIGMRILQLMMMEPGDDPLHPEMGVGIDSYKYSIDKLYELEDHVRKQIETYLPNYQDVDVTYILTPDKVINIEISIGDTVYIYDSATSGKPITLDDITSS